jgi:hypothetical protein
MEKTKLTLRIEKPIIESANSVFSLLIHYEPTVQC